MSGNRHWLGSASFQRAHLMNTFFTSMFPIKNGSEFLYSIYLLLQLVFIYLIHQPHTRTLSPPSSQDHLQAPAIGS